MIAVNAGSPGQLAGPNARIARGARCRSKALEPNKVRPFFAYQVRNQLRVAQPCLEHHRRASREDRRGGSRIRSAITARAREHVHSSASRPADTRILRTPARRIGSPLPEPPYRRASAALADRGPGSRTGDAGSRRAREPALARIREQGEVPRALERERSPCGGGPHRRPCLSELARAARSVTPATTPLTRRALAARALASALGFCRWTGCAGALDHRLAFDRVLGDADRRLVELEGATHAAYPRVRPFRGEASNPSGLSATHGVLMG